MEDLILIVDDEEAISSTLDKRLTREGYTCVAVKNGREALSHFYKDTFPLIITKTKMPEMGGIELLKRVKAINPNIRVIMVTAFPDINMVVEAMRLGAHDFIIMPVDLELVTLSVKKALENKRLQEEVEAYYSRLEELVEERTARLKHAYRILKKDHLDSVKVLAEAIDAKDPYTRGHSHRVSRISLKIAMEIGFSEDRIENLEYGALVHDIGKIGIKDDVLQKPGPLSHEEYQYIQEHPLIGVKIVEGVEFFKDKIPMIRNHHEHFDGTGYPDGLAGEDIPLEARIISVSDAFDAMTSLRPHRGVMPLQDVLIEFEKGKGKQFDPQILEIFLREKIYKL